MTDFVSNPFWVQTPDQIPADEAVHLFVDIFTEFPQVESPAHSFIVGPRGSGKSMMFRMMRPDCLSLRLQRPLNDLPYLGLYVPIKSTRITATELERMENHPAKYVFNEHLMCLYIAITVLQELSNVTKRDDIKYESAVAKDWIHSSICSRLVYCGVDEVEANNFANIQVGSFSEMFARLASIFDLSYWSRVDNLLRRLALHPDLLGKYDGPIFSYHGFLFPFLTALRNFSFLPQKPIFLLIDDADNLNRAQTEVINSWISTRTTQDVCIKLSDQMGYKTFKTYGGKRIQSPHDFNDVDVSVLYTAQRDRYLLRINDIVQKRLKRSGINVSPRQFFPEDAEQAEQLRVIQNELKELHNSGGGRGYRSSDDVTRYSRPELLRRLGGPAKSKATYSYAGFEQLAHISSGVVRYFLEPAAKMFSIVSTGNPNVQQISPSVQDKVIREFSYDFLDNELAMMRRDAGAGAGDYEKLLNLIEVMGESFADRIMDETASERRIFSIALNDRASDELQRILDLGTKEGFFYKATIGAKRGSGRVPRYVLSRRLAPRFKLDPTSFAGYLFVTPESLLKAIYNKDHRLRDATDNEQKQMELNLPGES